MRHTQTSVRMASTAALVAAALALSPAPTTAADPPISLVKDIKPGSGGSKPADMATVGSWDTGVTLYFSADDGSKGRELWKSVGAMSSGTKRVKDIRAGSGSSNPREMTAVGKKVFFSANDGVRGRELWITDGTAAGTKRVKDIRPGAKGSNPLQLTAVGRTLFFTANDGTRGRELWKSDGTSAGTVLLRNINKASQWTADLGAFDPDTPGNLTSFGGRLFFAPVEIYIGRYDGHYYSQLWVSDGTRAGTKPFLGWDSDDQEFETIDWPDELTRVGSRLYFRAGDELWRSNGTESGTRSMGAVNPFELTGVGGALFFRGNEWQQDSEGNTSSVREGLWKSSGTKATTVFVKPFAPPQPWCCEPGVTIDQLTNVDGTLYFTRNEDLWTSDGSTAGTLRLVNLPAGTLTRDLTSVGPAFPGRLYLTVNGTVRSYQNGSFSGPYAGLFSARNLTDVGGVLMLSATDGARGLELWSITEGD